MLVSLEDCVTFPELYVIKFSIVYEGQETKKNTQLGNYHWTIMLRFRTAPCPILILDKCDDDRGKGKFGLYFLRTLQDRKSKESMACAFLLK